MKEGPLRRKGWEKYLIKHPDRIYANTLLDIISFGAKIGYTGPDQFIISKNLVSANEAPATLDKDLAVQIEKDRVVKLTAPPAKFISSPLGLAPKPNGEWRRIHHLSHPRDHSVNDYIPEEWGTIEYPTFDDAVSKIRAHGQGCLLVKRDFADAFRHIPVAISDRWLLGFRWREFYWMEKFLPFGLRTSPFLFDLFAKGVNWMVIEAGHDCLHYLDDFLSVEDDQASANEFTEFFNSLCKDLGITIKEKKNQCGTTVDFLGIELDTIRMEARLPADKLHTAKNLATLALEKTSLSIDELDQILGFLTFCAKVVSPGRAFLRRLFNAKTSKASHIHLNEDMRADLLWWQHFLPQWNGITMLQPHRHSLWLWTDASGNYGMGGYILKDGESLHSMPVEQAYSEQFTTRLRQKHINVKEMTAILHALRRWLPLCKGSHLVLHCDNFPVAKGVKKTSIRGQAMHSLRAIVMLAAVHDIEIESIWISTKQNAVADLLSRGMIQKIANVYPQFQILTPGGTRQTHGIRMSQSAA